MARDIGVFLKDVFRKPPAPFPYIALFHVLAFFMMLAINWGAKITDYYVEVLWLIGFTVSCIYTCDLKKWAATSYILITAANLGLYLYFQFKYDSELIRATKQGVYVSAMLIPALIFSFFVLFFYKRFNETEDTTTTTEPDTKHKI
jgi:uncharacterized membrane protein AbrB (regulator of aidB expression)